MSIQDLNTELSNLYDTKCCTHLPNLQAQNILGLTPKVLTNMVSQVWKDKGLPKGVINKDVTTAFAKHLYAGVETGFGKSLSQLDYDTPDYNMLKSLQENTWTFAAAKNYTQLRELSDALLDEKGKLRSFNDFKAVASTINDKHIGRYLSAEYEFAVASSQMASKWVDIQNHSPKLLEFDAVMDAGTSAICSNLNGTRLPSEHAFWNRFYPPNHFGCRSTVRELNSGVATDESKIPSADIKPLFQTNLAKNGLVYPAGHSYFVEMPKTVKRAAENLIYDLPLDEQFNVIYKAENGAIVKQHRLHARKPNFDDDDYDDIIDAAKLFADKGSIVDILPEIPSVLKKARETVFEGYKHLTKNPDFKIGDTYYDLKRAKTFDSITKNANKASSQLSEAVIPIENISISALKNLVKNLAKRNTYKPKNIHFIKENKIITLPVNAKADNSL